jgi:quinoprotein dehydrogenase-associated probable ABC transporter substrate-binding protein
MNKLPAAAPSGEFIKNSTISLYTRPMRAILMTAAMALTTATLSPLALAADRDVLRVCADPNNLPFSNKGREGFENRLANILAEDLGVPVEYAWFPQRMGFIRNTLRSQDPLTGAYKCDLVMGVPHGFERTITTKPYYRSTYALVYVKGRGLDKLQASEDLLGLDDTEKQALRIGVFEKTPGAAWLAKHGMDRQMIAYPTLSGDPAAYPGEIIEKELASGTLDAAIVWGPIAGFFAKQAEDVEMALVPLRSEPGARFDFAISMGVRFGEGDWKREVEAMLDRNYEKIQALLHEYNVPLVSEGGVPLT